METNSNLTVPEQLPDQEVIGRVVAGEKKLYELLVRRYNPRLFRIGMSLLPDDMEVEELMQISFIRAYEHLPGFEGRSSFGTWLTRIFLNEVYRQLKSKQRMANISGRNGRSPLTDINPTIEMKIPDSLLLNKELGKALEHALRGLPEKYRLVFVMREIEDLSTAETMSILSISESNVKTRLNRAKTMLRDSLAGFYKNRSVYHFHLLRCDRIVEGVSGRMGI